jgi:hypothetical protein
MKYANVVVHLYASFVGYHDHSRYTYKNLLQRN